MIGFCAGLVLATLAFSETKITREALPLGVQAAVKQQTRGSDILGFATEREKGQAVYEVETKRNGKPRDLTFGGRNLLGGSARTGPDGSVAKFGFGIA